MATEATKPYGQFAGSSASFGAALCRHRKFNRSLEVRLSCSIVTPKGPPVITPWTRVQAPSTDRILSVPLSALCNLYTDSLLQQCCTSSRGKVAAGS